MSVYITNLYGMAKFSTAQLAQNMVADFAERELGYKELGIYFYDGTGEKEGELWARFDGIMAALSNEDTVIFQSPTWNPIEWDNQFMDRLSAYPGVKKVVFVHDVTPLMFKNNRYLMPKFISLYNKADAVIVPTERMVKVLQENGLKVKNIVIQKMWDHPAEIDFDNRPELKKLINFAGNPEKFNFMQDLDTSRVKVRLFTNNQTIKDPNVEYSGWIGDHQLLQTLRNGGGFGLVWGNGEYLQEYMKMDCSYKFSTYLAAGIPLIVRSDNPAADVVRRKNLGLVVDTLDEAVDAIEKMDEDTYDKMVDDEDIFARLIRHGYFTKRALVEAVFQAFYN